MTAFHIWAITETPESALYWIAAGFDLVVAAVSFGLGLMWPRYALFDDEGVVLAKQRIRYDSITTLRLGDVSAKPFWLALWIPTSLVIGLIVALVPRDTFSREVVEVGTENRTARFRWRDGERPTELVDAIRSRRPDLEHSYHLDPHSLARDFTPRMWVGGGFLAAGLAVWIIFTALTTPDLFDLSTQQGPYPTAATSAELRSLTTKLTGYEPLPGASVKYDTRRCSRNNSLLGDSPDVVELQVEITATGMSDEAADAMENRLRADLGMASDYFHHFDAGDTNTSIDIPEMKGLYVYFFTGCVDADDLGPLRDDLGKLAAAVGAGR